MSQNRRDFFKTSGIIAGGIALSSFDNSFFAKSFPNKSKSSKMKLTFRPYTLELKHVFTIATSSRTTTPVVLTEIEYEGLTGYGEASMPPYLGESHDTVLKFLAKVDLTNFNNPFELENILAYVDSIEEGNKAAKASVDIALHDLIGKIVNQPLYNIWGFDKTKTPVTSFTIGIDKPDVV
ncbi:MAG: dipeptide epimerase, partial [Ignavibacteriaceae bacterium]|nr:dipeptide epimerase [Ignavibacteriaceae bacterium]